MKQNITRLVAQCSRCHRALPADEMQGFMCDSCMDELRDEPPRVEWESDDED